MNFKKLTMTCLTLLLGLTLLGACSSGPSKEAKKLYNEQATILNKKIDYLEKCLAEEQPTQGIRVSYPTSFFHLTTEEQETWDDAGFDDKKTKALKAVEDIESDAEYLYNSAPTVSIGGVSQEEVDRVTDVFNELKEKYKKYDFSKVKITLYEE